MVVCFKCNQSFPHLKSLGRHLRNHNLSPDERYICAEKNCTGKSFVNFSNLCKHIKKHVCATKNEDSSLTANSSSYVNISDADDLIDISAENEAEEISPEDFESSFEKDLSSFICKMYANPSLPRNQIQIIIENTEDLLHQTITRLLNDVKKLKLTAENVPEENLTLLDQTSTIVKRTFHKFRSEYIRFNYFENQGTFVAPISFPIKYVVQPHSTASSNFYLESEVRSVQVVPLHKVLKSFLEAPDVFKKISEHLATLGSDTKILSDFTQGNLWKRTLQAIQNSSPPTDNVIHWPLFVFSDEYECGNPLGSHAGTNELTGVYATLPSLPPEYRSMISNIFLFGLMNSVDKDNVPNSILYKPFFDELMYLSSTGIFIKTPSFEGTIKFHLGLHLGDNLGLHEITDFIACFTANHPCRFCQVHRDIMRKQTKEDPNLLRTIENYDSDLLKNNPSETGINRASLWNELPYVHVVHNTSFDLHHDILQGAAVFDVNLILNFAISYKYISIHEINNLILNTNYGLVAKKNKPVPVIITGKVVHAKMSAAEMMNFVVFFGILFGKFFPKDDPVWRLYTLLRQIMDVIFSPYIDPRSLKLLESLIDEHHKIFLTWSQEKRLKNKQHHILHYPRLIEEFGPPLLFWVINLERKHQQGKKTAVSVATSRNLAKTVGIRHQIIHHCYMQSGTVLMDRKEFGNASEIADDALSFLSTCSNLPPDFVANWEIVPWTTIHSTFYEPGMVIVLPSEDPIYPDPEFGQIRAICVDKSNNVGFLCENLETLYFNSHVHCHQVAYLNSKEHRFVKQSDLSHFMPTNVISSSSGELYVPYRYGI